MTRISRHCAPYWYPKGAAAVTRTIPRECAFISTNLAHPRSLFEVRARDIPKRLIKLAEFGRRRKRQRTYRFPLSLSLSLSLLRKKLAWRWWVSVTPPPSSLHPASAVAHYRNIRPPSDASVTDRPRYISKGRDETVLAKLFPTH